MNQNALDIVRYCNYKQYPISKEPGELNIIYIEGLNEDFTENNDAFDGWNDLRIILDHDPDGAPFIAFKQVATTEPGKAHTFSNASKKNGGVARVRFGHYPRKWVMGYHNYAKERTNHPALVQKKDEVIMVHRDFNKDGKRTGDAISPAWGINHHGTKSGADPKKVGLYSAGCLVGKEWALHIEFIERLKKDVRYARNKQFAFSAIIIAGDDFAKFSKQTV